MVFTFYFSFFFCSRQNGINSFLLNASRLRQPLTRPPPFFPHPAPPFNVSPRPTTSVSPTGKGPTIISIPRAKVYPGPYTLFHSTVKLVSGQFVQPAFNVQMSGGKRHLRFKKNAQKNNIFYEYIKKKEDISSATPLSKEERHRISRINNCASGDKLNFKIR